LIRITRDLTIHETEFINTRRTVQSSQLFDKSDGEDESSQFEATTPVLEDSITVMPPDTIPIPDTPPVRTPASVPVPTNTAEPHLNRRQRKYLKRMAAKMAQAYISSVWLTTYHEAMNREDAKQWEQAIRAEYESIMRNNVWTLVPRPSNAKVVKTRWVLRIKDNGRYKARFCAKGFTQ